MTGKWMGRLPELKGMILNKKTHENFWSLWAWLFPMIYITNCIANAEPQTSLGCSFHAWRRRVIKRPVHAIGLHWATLRDAITYYIVIGVEVLVCGGTIPNEDLKFFCEHLPCPFYCSQYKKGDFLQSRYTNRLSFVYLVCFNRLVGPVLHIT